MITSVSYLEQILEQHVTPSSKVWIKQATHKIHTSRDVQNDFAFLSATARRKTTTNSARLEEPWDISEVVRVYLLVKALERVKNQKAHFIRTAYTLGDELERIALMKGLSLADTEGESLDLAIENGRTNSIPLFVALAMNNPYPAAFFSEDQFNQLVLKALFLGLSIESVYRLTERTNAELCRMCLDFISERQAAGRPIPQSIWLALMSEDWEQSHQLLKQHLDHQDPQHRYYTALAIYRFKLGSQYKEELALREEEETLRHVLDVVHICHK